LACNGKCDYDLNTPLWLACNGKCDYDLTLVPRKAEKSASPTLYRFP